jgi:hypothetical protein
VVPLSDAKDIATIVAVIVAMLTLVKAVFEYARQNAQRRAEHFVDMRKRFKSEPKFLKILARLDDENARCDDILPQDRRDLLGFFEEVALMVNSRLMNLDVAAYMFGCYAVKCWECKAFWKNDLSKNDPNWSLFSDFVKKVKQIQDFEPSKFRL